MKKRILLIAVFILGIIIIPVIVDWCIIGNEFPSNVSNEDWIAFFQTEKAVLRYKSISHAGWKSDL